MYDVVFHHENYLCECFSLQFSSVPVYSGLDFHYNKTLTTGQDKQKTAFVHTFHTIFSS